MDEFEIPLSRELSACHDIIQRGRAFARHSGTRAYQDRRMDLMNSGATRCLAILVTRTTTEPG
jgi:hypothetical protein